MNEKLSVFYFDKIQLKCDWNLQIKTCISAQLKSWVEEYIK